MFVIVNKDSYYAEQYYLGTYIVQGEYYLATTPDINLTKKYTSKKRAENKLNSLLNKFGVRYDLEIKESKENERTTKFL